MLNSPRLGSIKASEAKSNKAKEEIKKGAILNIPVLLDEIFYRLEIMENKLNDSINRK